MATKRRDPGPSVKDNADLRNEGIGKEKSARLANEGASTSGKSVGRKGGSAGS